MVEGLAGLHNPHNGRINLHRQIDQLRGYVVEVHSQIRTYQMRTVLENPFVSIRLLGYLHPTTRPSIRILLPQF